jgi:putative flippase GtrA
MRVAMSGRLFRFGVSGTVATLASYLSFVALMHIGLHYLLAGGGSWICGSASGFAMNRRFTFGIRGRDGRARQLGLFMVGAVLQLLLALAGYAVLIDGFHLSPSLAFAANLTITTSFGFTFASLVTFRNHR